MLHDDNDNDNNSDSNNDNDNDILLISLYKSMFKIIYFTNILYKRLVKLYINQMIFVHDEKYLSDVHRANIAKITSDKYVVNQLHIYIYIYTYIHILY